MATISAVERRHLEVLAQLRGIAEAIQALAVPVVAPVVPVVVQPPVVVPPVVPLTTVVVLPTPAHPTGPVDGPPPIPMLLSGRIEGATGGQLAAAGVNVRGGNVNNPVPVQSDGSFGVYGDKLLIQGMIWTGEPIRFTLDGAALLVRTAAGLQDGLAFAAGEMVEVVLMVG